MTDKGYNNANNVADLNKLIEKLNALTKEGKLTWTKQKAKDRLGMTYEYYDTRTSNSIYHLRKPISSGMYVSTGSKNSPSSKCMLEIFDKTNHNIPVQTIMSKDYTLLEELYQLVDGKVLNISERLNDLDNL